jgi:DNA-directed RNA polymerase specialized sigma24 family protein
VADTSPEPNHPFRTPAGASPAEAEAVRRRIGELLVQFDDLIYKYVYRVAGERQRADIDDLVQEARLRLAMYHLPNFRGEVTFARLWGYLQRACYYSAHKAVTQQRRLDREQLPPGVDQVDPAILAGVLVDPHVDPADRIPEAAAAIIDHLDRVLGQVSARVAAALIADHDITHDAAAAAAGCHPATMTRARRQLREWLTGQDLIDLTSERLAALPVSIRGRRRRGAG